MTQPENQSDQHRSTDNSLVMVIHLIKSLRSELIELRKDMRATNEQLALTRVRLASTESMVESDRLHQKKNSALLAMVVSAVVSLIGSAVTIVIATA